MGKRRLSRKSRKSDKEKSERFFEGINDGLKKKKISSKEKREEKKLRRQEEKQIRQEEKQRRHCMSSLPTLLLWHRCLSDSEPCSKISEYEKEVEEALMSRRLVIIED